MGTNFFEFHEQVNRRRKPVMENPPAAAGSDKKTSAEPVTVSQLTSRIDRLLKSGIPETIHVRAEISNFKEHFGSGHLYFTLKDAANCIECVMWKSDASRLKFTPQDGMELVAGGRVGVYGQRGRYQLYVTSLQPLGKGALEVAFAQLRAKLEAEGLFAAERKKALPRYPTGIVLVTSAGAAALQDMLKVLGRFPWLRVMLYPVAVQGDAAAGQIAAAIAHVNAHSDKVGAQLIVLARGGGSLEDLWAFNEEVVARAVAGSRLPIVSGIGHEVDVSIADLVADHHAHTPTEAAQVVTTHWRTARDDVDAISLRLRRAFRALVADALHRLRAIERHEAFRRPTGQINAYRQLLDDRQRALAMAMNARMYAAGHKLQDSAGRLDRRLPMMLRLQRDRLDRAAHDLESRVGQRLRRVSENVAGAAARLAGSHPRYQLGIAKNQVQSLSDRLARAVRADIARRTGQVAGYERQLELLGPLNVLKRGYSLTLRKKDGVILRSAKDVKPGDRVITRLADGEVESIAQDAQQLPLFE